MKKDIKLIFEDGSELNVFYGTTVREVLKELNDDNLMALRINGQAVSCDFEIVEDGFVNFIPVGDRIGQKIYINGLKYMYINAIKEVFGSKAVVNVKHSLDKGLYTEIETRKKFDASIIPILKKAMRDLCEKNLEFKSVNVSRSEAYDYVRELGETEKALNYLYMTNDSVTMFELGDEYNYFYYIMPPSTKVLSRFDLTYIAPNGIVLSYPINNVVPKYNPAPQVLDAFKSYEKKLSAMGIKYAGELNKVIVDGKISEFIQTNEIIYDQNLEDIAARVANDRKIRSIFISGPSSSGKTTTSKKLALYLKSMGLDIVDALDIKLFSDHLKKLLKGEEIIIPTFNFITGEKEFKGKPVTLNKNQILIVEGLHAINERLNGVIDKKNKLKIYISPFTPLALDRHNHISTTDLRLLRRMVRDYMHRGYSADQTLTSWMGMRNSEKNYVYPYQREADIILNTALSYEIGVLRTYAEPLLYSVNIDSDNYEEAIRILKFLRGFLNIPSEYVPTMSVLREFIGDSYFE